jgi:hypothetical protein
MPFFIQKFTYLVCDTSMNSVDDEESNEDRYMSHGWSPEEVSGVCTSVTSIFHIRLVIPLGTGNSMRN